MQVIPYFFDDTAPDQNLSKRGISSEKKEFINNSFYLNGVIGSISTGINNNASRNTPLNQRISSERDILFKMLALASTEEYQL